MRKFTLLSSLFLSMPILSGAFSNAAVPTRIDIERGNRLKVYGNFGNPMNCTNEGRFFIQKTHPQYSEIYSTILAAFTANKR